MMLPVEEESLSSAGVRWEEGAAGCRRTVILIEPPIVLMRRTSWSWKGPVTEPEALLMTVQRGLADGLVNREAEEDEEDEE